MEGINIWQLIILLVILILLFGTKKIRNIGGDLGAAIKSFKEALTGKNQENTVVENNSPANEAKIKTSESKTESH